MICQTKSRMMRIILDLFSYKLYAFPVCEDRVGENGGMAEQRETLK